MIPKWIGEIYVGVLKSGYVLTYFKNGSFECSIEPEVETKITKCLFRNGQKVGVIIGSIFISFLAEGKNWDDEGNLIENSYTGDILNNAVV